MVEAVGRPHLPLGGEHCGKRLRCIDPARGEREPGGGEPVADLGADRAQQGCSGLVAEPGFSPLEPCFDRGIGQRRIGNDAQLHRVVVERKAAFLAGERRKADGSCELRLARYRGELAEGGGILDTAARSRELGGARRDRSLPAMAEKSGTRQLDADRPVVGRQQRAAVADFEIQIGQARRTVVPAEHQRIEPPEAQFAIAVAGIKARLDQHHATDFRNAEPVAQGDHQPLGGEVGIVRISEHDVGQYLRGPADPLDRVAARDIIGLELVANDVVDDPFARQP